MHRIRHTLAAMFLLGLGGCAATKPCLVIPAQIELARDVREAARLGLEKREQELRRWENAVQQSQARVDRLTEDRNGLRDEVGIETDKEGEQ